MPCMCWYDPGEENKKYIKDRVVEIVDRIKWLEKEGDPYDCTYEDIKKLFEHLYYNNCNERK